MFDNKLQRFIMIMGMDGEDLLNILDVVEKRGTHKLTRQLLSNIANEHP